MSDSEEKTPTVSPDKGATGEKATSSKTMRVGMRTGLSEEEKETCYKKAYDDAVTKLWENIYMQDPEAGWDILIDTFQMLCKGEEGQEVREAKLLESW